MSLILWQSSYNVGIPVIDADHQLLVSLLNQLYDTREEGQARDVVSSVLTVLVEYTLGHFRREEHLLELAGYPELVAHRRQHATLAAEVARFQSEYMAGRHAAVDELVAFLKNWLTDHILSMDRRYKPYLDKVELTAMDLAGPFAEAPVDGGEFSAVGP